ncbi:MAG: hypothetical protein VB111_08355 [Clostridiaceae bacterium]|nr:hypothetical protein [Clostridiaceae bacterium]
MSTRIAAWLLFALFLFPDAYPGYGSFLRVDTHADTLAAALTKGFSRTDTATLTTADGEILRVEGASDTARVRLYRFPSGALVCQRQERAAATVTIDFTGSGTVRWVENGVWVEKPSVTSGTQTLYIRLTDGGETRELIVNPPKMYRGAPLGCVEEIPASAGTVSVAENAGNVRVTIRVPLPPYAAWADWSVVYADTPLIDWSNDTLRALWANYDLSEKSRLTFDGCCYKIEPDYEPAGENIFEYAPSMYVPNGMAQSGGSDAAFYLATVMLDLARSRYTDEGYFPTETRSLWLARDYGCAPGFFDTRFNTDTAYSYRKLGREYGIPAFLDVAERYTAYLLAHIETYGIPTENGVLAPDYAGSGEPTHASLNHMLAEILYLYRDGSEEASSAADALLAGIADLGRAWIRPNGNLHYAWLPDGSFGLEDYPYLTYNDLYNLQSYLYETTGVQNAAIDMLMHAKLAWMRGNGITGYKTDLIGN